jgi:hypothetical protein
MLKRIKLVLSLQHMIDRFYDLAGKALTIPRA